jgi:hypothetical protein
MNVFLWVLQGLLALHTAMGAAWKLSNSEQTVTSLSAIPHGIWLAMSAFELIVAVGLILPAVRPSLGVVAPVSAACIAVQMLLFCGLHLRSGQSEHGPMIYWLVVAVLCAFVAYGRLVLEPL